MSADFTTLGSGLKILAATPEEEGGQVLNDNFSLIDTALSGPPRSVNAVLFLFSGVLAPPVSDATNHIILAYAGTFNGVQGFAKTAGVLDKVFVVKRNGVALTTVTITSSNTVSYTAFASPGFSAGDKLSIDLVSGDGADVTVQLLLTYTP